MSTAWSICGTGTAKLAPYAWTGTGPSYWDELKAPSATLAPHSATLAVPGTWHREGFPKQGQATSALTLLLPDEAAELSLRMGSLEGAVAVWMNRAPLMPMGTLSPEPQRLKVDPRTLMADFDPAPRSVLVVQVANQMHRSSGIRQSVILGTTEQMRETLERQVVLDVATITARLCLGLGFLFVFIARPGAHHALVWRHQRGGGPAPRGWTPKTWQPGTSSTRSPT